MTQKLNKIASQRRVSLNQLKEETNKLSARLNWLSTCEKRDQDIESKRYKLAKTQYMQSISKCLKYLNSLQDSIEEAQRAIQHNDKFKEMEKEETITKDYFNKSVS